MTSIVSTSGFRGGRKTSGVISWHHNNPALSNQHCLYCGVFLGVGGQRLTTLEHWIGRNFVPKGTLGNGKFNFLFGACATCNGLKADYERHVSSVTLINTPGRFADPRAAEAARRKSLNDFHPELAGVRMGDASSSQTVEQRFDNGTMTFEFAAPVQATPIQINLLAVMQVQALFSLLTSADYRRSDGMRLLLHPTPVKVLGYFIVNDWGNPRLVAAERRTKTWARHASICTADGFFKAVMRRHETKGWFWALEWNRYMRVAGCFGPELFEPFVDLPDENWIPFGIDRIREEVPLTDGIDLLFAPS